MSHNVLDLIAVAETMGPPALPPEIASYEDSADPLVKGAWEIETMSSAEWALQRVAECEAEAAEIEAARAEAVSRLNARAEELKARAARGVNYFRFKLLAWMEHNRSSLLTGQAKSRALLHGTVGWRASSERLEVTDPAALETWLLMQPLEQSLYRIKVAPEMKAIQALYKHTGEIPAGCAVKPARDEAYIKADAPEAALLRKR